MAYRHFDAMAAAYQDDIDEIRDQYRGERALPGDAEERIEELQRKLDARLKDHEGRAAYVREQLEAGKLALESTIDSFQPRRPGSRRGHVPERPRWVRRWR